MAHCTSASLNLQSIQIIVSTCMQAIASYMFYAFVMSLPELCMALRPQRLTNHAMIVFFLHAFLIAKFSLYCQNDRGRILYVNHPLTRNALSGMMRLAWNRPLFISRGHRL